eukprot:5682037-Karenia_brevis.AAC.1
MDSAKTSPATIHEEGNNQVSGSNLGDVKTVVGEAPLPKPKPFNIKKNSKLDAEIKNLNAMNLGDATASRKFHAKASDTDAGVHISPGDDSTTDKNQQEW